MFVLAETMYLCRTLGELLRMHSGFFCYRSNMKQQCLVLERTGFGIKTYETPHSHSLPLSFSRLAEIRTCCEFSTKKIYLVCRRTGTAMSRTGSTSGVLDQSPTEQTTGPYLG